MKWIEKARTAILESSENSRVYIGSDSIRKKKGFNKDGSDKWWSTYATVIIIHKDGCHGGNVAYNIVTLPDYGNLRNRLLTEVQFSIDAFDAISDVLGNRHLEIHLDVNPDPVHGSNIVVKEATGWVLGMGLTPKIKDESWAASTAADYAAHGRFKHLMEV